MQIIPSKVMAHVKGQYITHIHIRSLIWNCNFQRISNTRYRAVSPSVNKMPQSNVKDGHSPTSICYSCFDLYSLNGAITVVGNDSYFETVMPRSLRDLFVKITLLQDGLSRDLYDEFIARTLCIAMDYSPHVHNRLHSVARVTHESSSKIISEFCGSPMIFAWIKSSTTWTPVGFNTRKSTHAAVKSHLIFH